MTLSQTFSFEAAHRLENRPICVEEGERVHGHSYFVEITLCGEMQMGMVIDSSLLKTLGEKIIYLLDHRFLNDIDGMKEPTLENIGKWIFNKSLEIISLDTKSVRVWRPSVGDCAIVAEAECDD